MKPVIGVLTCKRPGAYYLPETIAQIDRTGGTAVREKMIFVDGDDDEFIALLHKTIPSTWGIWPIGKTEFSCGAAAYREGLYMLARYRRDVLMFEDDLAICQNGVTRMLAMEVPDNAGLVSFFDMKEFKPGSAHGVYCLRPSVDPRHAVDKPHAAQYLGLWGSQCYRFPIDIVDWLIEQDWTKTALWPHGQDLVVGNLLEQHPSRSLVAFHIPCLVEHVGSVSAYSPFGIDGRTATNFIGRGSDALALPAFSPVTL